MTRVMLFCKTLGQFEESDLERKIMEEAALKEITIADLKISLAKQAINGKKPDKVQYKILKNDLLWNSPVNTWEQKLSWAYARRGSANETLHKDKEALEDYNKAIEADDNNDWAHYIRGLLKANIGDLQGALEDLEEAVEIDAKDSDYYCALAFVYDLLGYYPEASKSYTKAIRLSPDLTYIYYDRAKVYEKMGKLKLAEKDRKKAEMK